MAMSVLNGIDADGGVQGASVGGIDSVRKLPKT
jgi:hypothetical protein